MEPRMMSHALNGEMVPPTWCIGPDLISSMRLRAPMAAPPMASPWPLKYLVSEWMTRSAPRSSGRSSGGGVKVESIVRSAPAAEWHEILVRDACRPAAGGNYAEDIRHL